MKCHLFPGGVVVDARAVDIRVVTITATAATTAANIVVVLLIGFRAELAMQLNVAFSLDVMLAAFSHKCHWCPN